MSRANIRSEIQGLTDQDVHPRSLTVYQIHWLPAAPDDRRCTVSEKISGAILEGGERWML
jgi:hypothetical protein